MNNIKMLDQIKHRLIFLIGSWDFKNAEHVTFLCFRNQIGPTSFNKNPCRVLEASANPKSFRIQQRIEIIPARPQPKLGVFFSEIRWFVVLIIVLFCYLFKVVYQCLGIVSNVICDLFGNFRILNKCLTLDPHLSQKYFKKQDKYQTISHFVLQIWWSKILELLEVAFTKSLESLMF